jgi:hypothetical protein
MSNARSFLQERVIYEYLEYRAKQKKLYLYKIFEHGKRVLNKELNKVKMIEPIETSFPDINKMLFEGSNKSRPAEVKFLTSLFDYHKIDEYEKKFNDFKKHNGCIIVLKHDLLPKGLLEKLKADIFEIDIEDFRSFVIENFNRLLQKQLHNRESNYQRIWVTSQANNFYYDYKTYPVQSAKLSGIWCPTNNLTSYDLAKDDKIIFVKSGGEFQIKQSVNKYWKEQGEIYPYWKLQNIYIGKITSPIMSREEYCDLNDIDIKTPLWNDEYKSGKIKWSRVFCFKKEKEIIISNGISISEAHNDLGELIFPILFDVYTQQNTREITPNQYFSFLEYVSSKISEELESTKKINDNVNNFLEIFSKTKFDVQNVEYLIEKFQNDLLQ